MNTQQLKSLPPKEKDLATFISGGAGGMEADPVSGIAEGVVYETWRDIKEKVGYDKAFPVVVSAPILYHFPTVATVASQRGGGRIILLSSDLAEGWDRSVFDIYKTNNEKEITYEDVLKNIISHEWAHTVLDVGLEERKRVDPFSQMSFKQEIKEAHAYSFGDLLSGINSHVKDHHFLVGYEEMGHDLEKLSDAYDVFRDYGEKAGLKTLLNLDLVNRIQENIFNRDYKKIYRCFEE